MPREGCSRAHRGGCLCVSLAESQAERAGLEIIQKETKTCLSKQRHLYGKNTEENSSFGPQFRAEGCAG